MPHTASPASLPPRVRATRSDGERRRREILTGATELATLEGLDGLSIGRLASEIGMSKSGVYAHFGSKEELQLATIDEAEAVFDREVTEPGLAQPAGLAQVWGVCDAFFSYLERGVFPGGCFFAAVAAELDTREGPVKDRIRVFFSRWSELLAALIAEAQRRRELPSDLDPRQLAFELDSLLLGANAAYVLTADPEPLGFARRAITDRIGPRP